jgi:hypothetical protein
MRFSIPLDEDFGSSELHLHHVKFANVTQKRTAVGGTLNCSICYQIIKIYFLSLKDSPFLWLGYTEYAAYLGEEYHTGNLTLHSENVPWYG